jgi:methylenetetrahydrofolate dehydrogenase (NADP+)/methenyltetrahydrofolate cyclohydrolase
MKLIDGRKVSEEIYQSLKVEVDKIKTEGGKVPHLAAVLVGNNPASQTYVNAKVKACEQVGFGSTLVKLEENITEETLMATIKELNENIDIDGFIVQLPLPHQINENKVTQAIAPHKDVDGFHPTNLRKNGFKLTCILARNTLWHCKIIRSLSN